MPSYVVLDKIAGETPLQALEEYRANHPELSNISMAYAGRLDPMASGKLLILIGDECKQQTRYHSLDKSYTVEILFGLSSDTGDILGRLQPSAPPSLSTSDVVQAVQQLPPTLTLPYPRFSAKTVQGKPLHVWTLEERLHEITIPTQTGTIYRCDVENVTHLSPSDLYTHALARIDHLPIVTESSKALGADFRRTEVRADWNAWNTQHTDSAFPVATITCVVSSGTYMRSLAEYIATQLGTRGLAYSIHRTHIGRYHPLWRGYGWWRPLYR